MNDKILSAQSAFREYRKSSSKPVTEEAEASTHGKTSATTPGINNFTTSEWTSSIRHTKSTATLLRVSCQHVNVTAIPLYSPLHRAGQVVGRMRPWTRHKTSSCESNASLVAEATQVTQCDLADQGPGPPPASQKRTPTLLLTKPSNSREKMQCCKSKTFAS